jgi:mono/diheme cytochrome c family protein
VSRLHALWTLEGLSALTADDIRSALRDGDVQVRAAAVRMASPDLIPDLVAAKDDASPLVLAHLAIRLSAVNQPAADQALAELLSRHGQNALIREGALSGARGREVVLAQAVATAATRENLSQTGPVLEALAALVSQAGKAGPFEQMLGVAVTLNDRTNLRDAVLRGLDQTIRDAKTKKTNPLKTIWLSSEPVALAKLRALVKAGAGLTHLTSLSSRLAWMGKPGAPAPPKITALTKVELARFEKGKAIFTALCAPCHQPHGYGLDGLAPPLVDSDWVLGKPDVTAKIVLNGLGGPIKVGNRTWDLSMPPMGMLNDEDAASVLTYIRREWEHNASPVDAKFVAGVRKQSATHPNSWTADELRPPTKKAAKASKEEAAK